MRHKIGLKVFYLHATLARCFILMGELMMPITLEPLALAQNIISLVTAPGSSAAYRGFDDTNLPVSVALQYGLYRVFKAVSVTRLRQRKLGLHRIQKRAGR